MFHAKGIKKIGEIIKFLKFFKVFPFAWKESSSFLINYETTVAKCLRVLFLMHLLLYEFYLIFQFRVALKKPVIDISTAFWIVFFAALFFLEGVSLASLQFKSKEMCFYFKEIIGTYEKISCKSFNNQQS